MVPANIRTVERVTYSPLYRSRITLYMLSKEATGPRIPNSSTILRSRLLIDIGVPGDCGLFGSYDLVNVAPSGGVVFKRLTLTYQLHRSRLDNCLSNWWLPIGNCSFPTLRFVFVFYFYTMTSKFDFAPMSHRDR